MSYVRQEKDIAESRKKTEEKKSMDGKDNKRENEIVLLMPLAETCTLVKVYTL